MFINGKHNVSMIVPFLVMICLFFIYPLSLMIYTSFYNGTIVDNLPRVSNVLKRTTFELDEVLYSALYEDFHNEDIKKTILFVNHYYPEYRSLVLTTLKNFNSIEKPYKQSFIEIDKRWGDIVLWETIQKFVYGFNVEEYKRLFGFKNTQVYLDILIRTLVISFVITLVACIFSYPVAYYLTTIKNKVYFSFLMSLVLIPLFSSYLSRLVAWMVILQNKGLVNHFLTYIGFENIQLTNNLIGVFIGSVYIVLPMTIIPMYLCMKNIPNNVLNSAKTLGASSISMFVNVYWPLSKFGVYNSFLIAFITCIGFYTTPALLGGGSGKFITEQIVRNIEVTLNWGLASAISLSLLIIVLIMFVIYYKVNKRSSNVMFD